MASNVSRGSAAKAKTKKWLQARGYQVGNLEEMRIIWISPEKQIPQKRDQFASDLLAVNSQSVIFVQVKSGEAARTGTFPEARREFAKFVFPESLVVRRWIIAWPFRTRHPRIIEIFGAQSESFGEFSCDAMTASSATPPKPRP